MAVLVERQCRQILRRHRKVLPQLLFWGTLMRLCYIDESGDTGAFTLDNVNSQPVFLLTALFMPQEHLANVTRSALPSSRPLGFVDWLLLVRAQALFALQQCLSVLSRWMDGRLPIH